MPFLAQRRHMRRMKVPSHKLMRGNANPPGQVLRLFLSTLPQTVPFDTIQSLLLRTPCLKNPAQKRQAQNPTPSTGSFDTDGCSLQRAQPRRESWTSTTIMMLPLLQLTRRSHHLLRPLSRPNPVCASQKKLQKSPRQSPRGQSTRKYRPRTH